MSNFRQTSKLTKEQSLALLKVYHRDLMRVASNCEYEIEKKVNLGMDMKTPRWKSFLDCRRKVSICYDCIMIQFGNYWLGIEKDGYTHS